jgi:hypothetical protein
MICSETIERSSCSRGQDHLDKGRKAGFVSQLGDYVAVDRRQVASRSQVRPWDRQLHRLPSRDQAMLTRSPRNMPRPGSTGERSGQSRHWIAWVIVGQRLGIGPRVPTAGSEALSTASTSRTGHGSLKQGFRRRQTHQCVSHWEVSPVLTSDSAFHVVRSSAPRRLRSAGGGQKPRGSMGSMIALSTPASARPVREWVVKGRVCQHRRDRL